MREFLSNTDFKYLFTSLDGRIGRPAFWIGMGILILANMAAIAGVVALFGLSDSSVALAVLLAILLVYPTYALMVKRFQDRDRPGWLAFFVLGSVYGMKMLETAGIIAPEPPNTLYNLFDLIVFGVTLWILIDLGILKGTQGPNRFGPDPLGAIKADAAL